MWRPQDSQTTKYYICGIRNIYHLIVVILKAPKISTHGHALSFFVNWGGEHIIFIRCFVSYLLVFKGMAFTKAVAVVLSRSRFTTGGMAEDAGNKSLGRIQETTWKPTKQSRSQVWLRTRARLSPISGPTSAALWRRKRRLPTIERVVRWVRIFAQKKYSETSAFKRLRTNNFFLDFFRCQHCIRCKMP